MHLPVNNSGRFVDGLFWTTHQDAKKIQTLYNKTKGLTKEISVDKNKIYIQSRTPPSPKKPNKHLSE